MAAILDDLDSFLAHVGSDDDADLHWSDSSEEESEGEDFGDACAKCTAGFPPVLRAVTSGHTGCLKEILRVSGDMKLRDVLTENGATLAHVATRRGDLEALQAVVEADSFLCRTGDVHGATPLHVCAYHGRLECLSLLLAAGGDPSQRDFDGATPVHFAAASGHQSCLKALVEEGKGDPNQQTNSGETPVYYAAQEGHLDCVHWLVERAGADPRSASHDGMTPLHAAAQTGRLNVTHWLVRTANCSIACRTSDGATPVHFAAAKGHVGILEWLLHHSLATGLERDDFGATPVHDAAEQGQLDCLHVFYNHSVSLDLPDCDGFTPRDLAEEKCHRKCVSFLENPKQAFLEQKRLNQEAMNEELKQLISPKDEAASSNLSKSKKKRTFSFFKKSGQRVK